MSERFTLLLTNYFCACLEIVRDEAVFSDVSSARSFDFPHSPLSFWFCSPLPFPLSTLSSLLYLFSNPVSPFRTFCDFCEQNVVHVLIHPYSNFFKCWEFLSGLLILYSTTLTPFILVYLSEMEGWCQVRAWIFLCICVSRSRSGSRSLFLSFPLSPSLSISLHPSLSVSLSLFLSLFFFSCPIFLCRFLSLSSSLIPCHSLSLFLFSPFPFSLSLPLSPSVTVSLSRSLLALSHTLCLSLSLTVRTPTHLPHPTPPHTQSHTHTHTCTHTNINVYMYMYLPVCRHVI